MANPCCQRAPQNCTVSAPFLHQKPRFAETDPCRSSACEKSALTWCSFRNFTMTKKEIGKEMVKFSRANLTAKKRGHFGQETDQFWMLYQPLTQITLLLGKAPSGGQINFAGSMPLTTSNTKSVKKR